MTAVLASTVLQHFVIEIEWLHVSEVNPLNHKLKRDHILHKHEDPLTKIYTSVMHLFFKFWL